MSFINQDQRGVTLLELLISCALLSVVFIVTSTVYLSGLKLLSSTRESAQITDGFLAMEYMVRRIPLGNKIEVNESGSQLTIRWDRQSYAEANNEGRGTPNDYSDDTYIKYAFINHRLRYRLVTSGHDDAVVTDSDVEVIAGLNIPTGRFDSPTTGRVNIEFNLLYGSSLKKSEIFKTSVALLGGAP